MKPKGTFEMPTSRRDFFTRFLPKDRQSSDSSDGNDVPLEAYPIALSKQGGLSFKIAVVADLDAYLKLEFGSNGKEK